MKTVAIVAAFIVAINLLFWIVRIPFPFFESVQWIVGAALLVLGLGLSQSKSVRGELLSRSRGRTLDEQTISRLLKEKKAQEIQGLAVGAVGLSLILSGLLFSKSEGSVLLASGIG